ncbi:MAG: hypothetical protein ACXVPU_17360 [Bacteroidia bacterium]
MNSPKPILKIVTLSVFSLLIICFVAYRAGVFENSTDSGRTMLENGFLESQNTIAIDTPKTKSDSVIIENKEMMSSSKSIVIYKQPPVKNGQTINGASAPASKTDTTKKVVPKKVIMSSSKSAFIYDPNLGAVDSSSKKKK